MREILFRGKRKDNGEWIEGSAINTQYDIRGDKHTYIGIFVTSERYPLMKTIEWYEVYPETVGEYIGLTDKNGKKIFEGDIVKADDYIFSVKFGKCGGVANAENHGYMGFYFEAFSEATKIHARFGLRNDICYFTDIEVIGNIHNNPELLKGGDE